MSTIGFRMQLHPGVLEEYKRRHDAIWPELMNELRAAGISDYSIFVDPKSLNLFAVLKLAEINKRDELALQPIMQRWWEYMADLMETDASKSIILSRAQKIVVLADSSKIRRTSSIVVADLDRVSALVTDDGAERQDLADFHAAGVRVVIANVNYGL